LDFGAGTGRLSLSSAFLNPHKIISIDMDYAALKILRENIAYLQIKNIIFPLCSDVKNFKLRSSFIDSAPSITTIMNPPFGVQTRGADRIFLNTAFSISDIVYSIHLANQKVQKFIDNFARNNNWHIDYILPYNMILDKTFKFHEKKRKKIDVNVYRFVKN